MTAAQLVLNAFAAESGHLTEIAAETSDADFALPSPCAPWTVGELLYHVQMTMDRLQIMLTATTPVNGAAGLVTAPGYYRADQRFSATVNNDRILSARRGAATQPDAAARSRDFSQSREQALRLLRETPPDRIVLTRHGDRMLLTEFIRTRVLELAVHGLDLAAGLHRDRWMTAQAAQVTEELLVAAPEAAAGLRATAGWDRVTLIAKLTGRAQPTAAEMRLISGPEARPLALG